MSFGNPSELFLLAGICCLRLMLFSVSACLVFVASTERKIGPLPSMAVHICVTTCDAFAADHVVRFSRPFPSVFAYCKRSKTGAGEGLGTRLLYSTYTVIKTAFSIFPGTKISLHEIQQTSTAVKTAFTVFLALKQACTCFTAPPR